MSKPGTIKAPKDKASKKAKKQKKAAKRARLEAAAAPTAVAADIAVVGLALRFPGAEDLDGFWDILKDGRCMISEVPAERWDASPRLRAMAAEAPDKAWGGFIDQADCFDAPFFNISPREARTMDPQQRLVLELSWKAMEDAGYAPTALAGSRTGVFMGVCHWDYAELFEKSGLPVDAYLPTGTAYSIIANRVSYWFDLTGPSVTNDTACSSSLVAVQQAVQALRAGECTAALAGGVNLIWSPNHFIAFHKNGMLSKHGRSRAFDRRADGYVRGEGAAVLLLKTLELALADGDAIHAVIKGVGSNHGGRTSALTVTNPRAQADLIRDVHQAAGVAPSTVSYIEAHGTGTPVGDPIEMLGLKKAFEALSQAAGETPEPGHCAVGSVKTNIGHLEGAAGVAGMVKVIAAMRHGLLPPNHDFAEPNPMLRLAGTPFRVAQALEPWPAGADGRRRAGVSSFGFGGTNAHALLESWPETATPTTHEGPVLVPLSARDGDRLAAAAAALAAWLDRHPDVDLAALAHTLQTGRTEMTARLACVAASAEGLAARLRAFAADRAAPVDGLWWAEAASPDGLAGLVGDDADARALLDTWMRKRRLDRLAELWVGGATLDWAGLWGKARPPRLHLPTYPFARHRYWYPEADGAAAGQGAGPALHPLLAENRSSFAALRFLARLRRADAVLADHVIGGRHVLPGVAGLEIVRAAARQAFDLDGAAPLTLDNVVWLRPLVVEDAEAEVEVTLDPRPDGGCGFALRPAGDAAASPFCQGIVAPGVEAPARLDLDALRAACPDTVAVETCYARLAAGGIAHGQAFRALDAVRAGAGRAVADLVLPQARGLDDARWGLHPILVDAAVQAIAALVGDGEIAGIPFAVDAVSVVGPWDRAMVGVVEATGPRRYDVTLCAPDGTVSVRLSGLTTRALDAGAEANTVVAAVPAWGPAEEDAATDAATTLLVAAPLAAAAPSAEILDLPAPPDAAAVEAALGAILARLQDLLRAGAGRLVVALPSDHPLLPAVAAMIATVGQESSRVSGRVIGVDDPARLTAEALAREVRRAGPPVVRLTADGRRLARAFTPTALEGTVAWPAGGVVWVTGGAGGLGRPLADHLRAHGVGTVVLSSRSAATGDLPEGVVSLPVDVTDAAAVAEAAATIRARFGRLDGVIHAAGVLRDGLASTKDAETLAAVLAPKVRGALALDAATADDDLTAFVLFSSIASVHGNAGQVDYAAANGVLDGIAAWRHAEVAAGRRKGRTLAVNWPLWADGGMTVDAAGLKALKRRMGIEPLPTAAGLAALDAALAGAAPQVAVAHGPAEAVRRFLETGTASPPAATASALAAPSAPANGPALRDRLIDHLRATLGAVLDMAADGIRPDVGFDTYGFDSIVAVDMIGRLEDGLGPLPKTLFFEYVDLNGVAGYLLASHGEAVARLLASEPEVTPDAAPRAAPIPSAPSAVAPPPVARASLAAPALLRGGRDDRHAIAVIGVGGRYPGADTLDDFWANLAQGRHAFTPIPKERWPHEEIYFPERDVLGKSTIQTGGFLRDIDAFDPRYFSVSQRDAELMSPEVRLLLQVAVETFEDAGYSREALQADLDGDVGVLVGTMSNHYNLYGVQNMLTRGARASGSYTGTMPNMVSYYYGLTGPSIFVDTMCSASSTAVDLAVRLLREGQTRMVLAGGVNLLLHPFNLISSSQEHFTSKTAEVIRSFGLGADGTILGEGVGTVLLKPLAEAERDGDNIHGVIIGTAMTNAGVRNGFTVPSPALQAKAVRLALEDAGVGPETISYLEAHGSGTRLGDPIEMAALHQVFGSRRAGDQHPRCAIGSVKSNVAHLLAAAGIVGLTKVLLQLRHGQIAPSLHSAELNPSIDFAASPFAVQQTLSEWRRPVVVEDGQPRELPRRAGVTSIGAGGMNSHIVVEEYQPPAAPPVAPGPYLFVFSAMTPDALDGVLGRMEAWLAARPEADAADVAWTLQVGRTALPCRLALVAADAADLARQVAEARAGGARRWYAADVLAERAPSPEAVAAAVGGRDLGAIAAAWIAGAAIDWAALWGAGRPRRLSLPTYPFARVRCWYEVYDDAPSVLNPEAFRRRLHPLIGRNASDLRRVGFVTDLRLDDLLDYTYRLGEGRSLPAPVALDTALAAARLAGAEDVSALRGVRWSPIVWADARRLHIAVEPAGDEGARVVLTWEDATGARFQWLEAEAVAAAPTIAAPQPPAQGATVLDQGAARAAFAEAGLDHAPYLPVVARLEVDDAGRGRAVVAPPAYRQDHHRKAVALEPEALAAIAQVGHLVARHLGLGGWAQLTPTTLEALACAPAEGPLAVAEVRFALARAGAGLRGDLTLHDADGTPLAGLRGLAWTAPARRETAAGEAGDVAERLRAMMAAILKFDPTDIDDRTGVYALGFDSITLTDLTERINGAFGTALTPAVFYDVQTVAQLTEEIERQRPTTVATGASATAEARPVPAAPAASGRRAMVAAADARAPIAVIGYAGRLPGAPDMEAFADLLRRGEDALSDLPLERYGAAYAARMAAADFPKRGGFLDDLARFDADFFTLSPAEAERLDPQHRLALETAWATLESAALRPRDLPGDTGVFFGVSAHDWESLLAAHGVAADGHVATGTSHAMLANRLSYLLDIHGPSEAIDTACSSSLVAVHRAVEALRGGRCAVALAGGVNVTLSLESFAGPHRAGMLAPDGRCKTFAAGADGYVRGEGVGAVLLKPLDAALRDGDPVHGVILGSAENHGGRASALTAPNSRAQADLVVSAMAGIDPATIDYVEAHGTGTELGDPVEVNALMAAYARLAEAAGTTLPPGRVALGSVKTMIGHLEAAAGIAGLLKLLVSLRQEVLPPSLNCPTLNPYLALDGSPFTVQREARAWTGARRRAAVSSFGFGGANAHVVVEGAPLPAPRAARPGPHVIVLSARRADRLEEAARRLRRALEAPGVTLDAVAWTLQAGREPMEERLAIVAHDLDDLRRRLDGWLAGALDGVTRGRVRLPLGFPETRQGAEPAEAPLGDPAAVAAAWCAGRSVDWARLWPEGPPPRLSLPTYPFAGERHWPCGDGAAVEASAPAPSSRVLDLLDDLIAGRVDARTASRRVLEDETP